MIDPLEPHTRIVSCYSTDQDIIASWGSFTAQDDLTLRSVRFTAGPDAGVGRNTFVLSADPDLSPLMKNEVSTDFRLIAVVNDIVNSVVNVWDDLAFPLAKGQTLYWGSQGSFDLIQLYFS